MVMKYKVKAKLKGNRTMRVVYDGKSMPMMISTAARMMDSDDVTECYVTIFDYYGKEEIARCK